MKPLMHEQKSRDLQSIITSTFFSIKFIKFMFAGGLSYLCAFSQMYVYTQVFNIQNALAYAVTQALLIIMNFFIARQWIFFSLEENAFKQGMKYIAALFAFRFTDWCLFLFFNNYFGIRYYFSIILAMAIVFPLKFLVYKTRIFKNE